MPQITTFVEQSGLTEISPAPETILFDDFEVALLKWAALAGTVTRSVARAYNGNGCLSVASAVNNAAFASRGFPLTIGKRLGFECRWGVTVFDNIDHFTLGLGYSIGTCAAGIRFFRTSRYWQCLDNTGYQTILPSLAAQPYLPQPVVGGGWHTFKFVADFNLEKYVSLEVDDMKLDLSQFSLACLNVDSPRGCAVTCAIQTNAVGAATLFLDDIRITME